MPLAFQDPVVSDICHFLENRRKSWNIGGSLAAAPGARRRMSAETLIRLARAADVPAVRAIVSEAWLASYGPLVGADKVAAMADALLSDISLRNMVTDSSAEAPIALVGGVPAATALARRQSDCLHVQRLYVAPRFQRRGLGPALLAWLAARHRAGLPMRLEAAAANTEALRFYAREGFADIGGGQEIIAGIVFDIRRLERPGRPE